MTIRFFELFRNTGVALMVAFSAFAQAAEIRVMSTNALKSVLEELGPQFEKATSNRLAIRFAPAADLKGLIEKGEAFDVAILTAAAVDDLIKKGKLAAATRADITKSAAGVAYRKGAPKPDVSTGEALKRSLLSAKSVAYVGTGATGAEVRKIFERFGIADEMKAKTKLLSGVSAAAAVAKGEAELGFSQVSELIGVEGAVLAGPFPPGFEVQTVFPAAVGTGAREPAAAQALIKFLTAPAAAPVIRSKGMEPG